MMNILVVGGNGFIGSAVCKAAVARGMGVTSISSSGRPFRTPKGHSPAWTERVDWRVGDALQPEQYSSLLDGKTAVVHTLGILFESWRGKEGYKEAMRKSDPIALASAIKGSLSGRNPLAEGGGEYEKMNRDSALTVCSTFAASAPPEAKDPAHKRAFIYLSAEDMGRPVVPARYIETKRAAERGIAEMLNGREDMRAVFVRPTLVYHSHFRPLTTPIATLFDLSATVHRKLPSYFPTPAGLLRTLASSLTSSSPPSSSTSSTAPPSASAPGGLHPSALTAVANALTVPPIHLDHVAQAIVRAIEDDTLEGVMDVPRMREAIGWKLEDSGRKEQSPEQSPERK